MKLIHGGDWAGYESEYGERPLDFSASVSPLGLPEGVRLAALRAVDEAPAYPDPLCRALCAALSAHHGVPEENIVCGNGAADLIYRLCRALKPKRAAVFAPGFAEYALALRSEACEVTELLLPEEADFQLTEEAAARLPGGAELLFLCNPNNPTGLLAERAPLLSLLRRCRERGTVLAVDESFLDFCADPDAHSLVGALSGCQELAVLRSFTKTYALAGLRLGYILCGSAELAGRIRRAGQPWPVSCVAQAAGLAALRDIDYVNRLRTLTAAERRRMSGALRGLGLRVIPGEANFLLFCCGDAALAEALRERGILIRSCGDFTGLSARWYRIAIRTEAENDRLLSALKEALHG